MLQLRLALGGQPNDVPSGQALAHLCVNGKGYIVGRNAGYTNGRCTHHRTLLLSAIPISISPVCCHLPQQSQGVHLPVNVQYPEFTANQSTV